MNKYRNIKTEVDGILFHSKKEAMRYGILKMLERGGAISELKMQVAFELIPSIIIQGKKKPALRYIADFTYVENGKWIVEDVKGALTDVYKIKRHLMKYFRNIDILET